ncbi:Os06g0100266 [Oryza sativa Japonica Group]|uniref:Os06g0100266 protein n=1 Tax=Oryza sativa subsp. japonica TaxID=39947 RepID=C7J444_ORYSJ|nr:Os06g0100266 [Oryza sativa Japonica Group]|eukprot:NP_001174556.1 Os06g0100266 [Oryza sativa Japonica Group]
MEGPKASSSALGAVICSCIQPEQRRFAAQPLAKYTLELCVSTPPPVAAAAMKECVLDEYATKHRISIDRFLQLRIFVKVHDRRRVGASLTSSTPF